MRNGETVWYCKRKQSDDGVITFEEPKAFRLQLHYLTIQPMSGYMNVVEFGEDVGKMWNCIGQPYDVWKDMKEGDRFYVDGAEPSSTGVEPDEGWGYDANAEIYSVRPQNLAIRFILRRIQ